jgi:hypothetical protein
MAAFKNLDGYSNQELTALLNQGGRFVVYKYCVSIVVMTFRRGSDIYFIPPHENAILKGLPYTLLSLVLGWWGIPWGPIYTIGSLYTNLTGGKDIIDEVINAINAGQGIDAIEADLESQLEKG